jgi:nucleoside-diphosphate-sugar epimerase
MSKAKPCVLVTGISGFLGQSLIRRLGDEFAIVGFDVVEPKEGAPQPDQFLKVDLTSEASVAEALAAVEQRFGPRIASVIHLAAFFDLSGENDPKYEAVNVGGTERLLRGLQRLQVEQIVLASTMLVHAPVGPEERIDEEHPLDPKMPYERSKVACERLVRELRGAAKAVLLRLAGIYDDSCKAPFIANQIALIFERSIKSHLYPGDLRTGQAFLHVEDFAQAVRRLVSRRERLPEETTLLLGEPEVLTHGDLQERIGQLLHGKGWRTMEVPQAVAKVGWVIENRVRPTEPFIKPWMVDFAEATYALDIGRARALLEWEPERRLEDSLPSMVEALRADPRGWYGRHGLDPRRVSDYA